jgi:hypothetical protein
MQLWMQLELMARLLSLLLLRTVGLTIAEPCWNSMQTCIHKLQRVKQQSRLHLIKGLKMLKGFSACFSEIQHYLMSNFIEFIS